MLVRISSARGIIRLVEIVIIMFSLIVMIESGVVAGVVIGVSVGVGELVGLIIVNGGLPGCAVDREQWSRVILELGIAALRVIGGKHVYPII